AKQPNGTPGIKGVKRVLYHLPELLAADPAEIVLIPEGEKDVDTMRAHGFTATCNPFGAGKWRDEYSEWLRGRHVVILPDNDDAGRAHAAQVSKSLAGVAASLRMLELPDLPDEGGDVSDWFGKGGTVEQLLAMVVAMPAMEP